MKTCIKCDEKKPMSAFHKHRYTKDGYFNICRPCKNTQNYHNSLKRKYGITVDDLNTMREQQEYSCATCGRPEDVETFGRHGLFVDHDHETGEVRGLLCHGCNVALGMARDDPETLRNLALYLESFRE